MVKVRDDQPLQDDGHIDVTAWLAVFESHVRMKEPERFRQACFLAEQLARAAELRHPDSAWRNPGASLHIGLEMASIVSELKLDEDALIAAVLYRCVREELVTLEAVRKRFGSEVAGLIDGVLKMAAISQLQAPAQGLEQHNQHDNLRRMLVTMVDDVRVALVKIVERTCMLREVRNSSRERCLRVAQEVFDIYAPLAHRLGVGHIKWELEDLSFRYLHENDYKAIARQLAEKRLDRDRYISEVLVLLENMLSEQGITPFDVTGRAKHIYSIWRKMKRKGIDFSEVYDVRAVRILVPRIADCYTLLGLVHSRWHHVPNEFDDYIANPKKNGYQSLHTAVIGPENKVLEIQVRTFDMHEEAELGVCAHWRYKGTDVDSRSRGYEEKIAWLRQVLEWQDEVGDLGDLGHGLRSDVAPDRIYVFTPDGHVIDLPSEATPIDFAYRVHTEVGHLCRGAKINGRIVPLTYLLKTGQQIEILTATRGGPSRDWLNPALGFVKTSRARAKIQAWFKLQAREQNLEDGRTLLEKEFRRLDLENLDRDRLARAVNYTAVDDMYAAIGAGDLRVGQVLSQAQHLFGEDDAEEEQHKLDRLLTRPRKGSPHEASSGQVMVLGVGNLKTQMANCCHPVPGDQIVGFITHGRGVTIHRQDCPNILQLKSDEPQRIVEVDWGDRPDTQYPVDIEVQAWDRSGLLRDVTTILSGEKVNVLSVNTRTDQMDNMATLNITLEVSGIEMLGQLFSRIQQLPNVMDVKRLRQGGDKAGDRL
ncbi:GTP diphosphokinase [Larsenimonas rhizosphaerae]|uniref:GTP pyrophosphokinase n=1 Tax=Larsenimonas rhizosphaerae TaxID=2944682 RepID=A0AA41ZFJ2_9GAMM|nr:GTP diphosphokinase [Larsenimonas rhizosphaerae]MCM2130925.1 GTP diphosphokinase [Larsenimonas rhizosphaerae]MCX2523630.1 GTP diphosphokinase [Larsenimonas rhizosphaerae]